MITKWKVFNFKSIREETELDFGPLTIFAGANSSGKSTFIQSILLVAQTLAHKISSRSVVLNGVMTSLGQFDDLKSNGSQSDQIVIKCTCHPVFDPDEQSSQRLTTFPSQSGNHRFGSNDLREVSCEIAFDADQSSSERDLFQIQPRLFASQLNITFRDDYNIDQKAEMSVRHSNRALAEIEGVNTLDEIDDQLRGSLAYDIDLDDASINEVRESYPSANPVGCALRHFLPERLVHRIDKVQEDANVIARILQGETNLTGVRRGLSKDFLLTEEIVRELHDILGGTVEIDDIFNDLQERKYLLGSGAEPIPVRTWLERLSEFPRETQIKVGQVLRETDNLFDRIYQALKKSNSSSEIYAIVQTRPPRQITEAILYLDSFFASSLKYLGPLRDAPKPLYPLASAADPYDVGLRGEHTAAVLDLHKNKQIRYIPSSYFKTPTINQKTVTRTLEAAVIDWLQYLGVASSVNSKDQGKLGHELKVGLANSAVAHDLTHVGVGVSQVLPILVICLLAGSDSTLVFEQPELHLHPKVQTLLGDFFLSIALCNKQCIVETHSEYLIDRLRFRIAAASESNLNNKAKIYFVEKPELSSSFREVVINEYGAIIEWPEGFFDQSQQLAEDILRAATIKRKTKRSKTNE